MLDKCRICFNSCSLPDQINITSYINKETTVLQAILIISNVEVLNEDPLPQFICGLCWIKLNDFIIFRNLILQSDNQFKNTLNNFPKASPKSTISNSETDFEEENTELLNEKSVTHIKEEIDNTALKKVRKNNKLKSKKLSGVVVKTERKFECTECQKSFKKADHLNVHITYKHLEKQFTCDMCEKKFARKYDLNYHKRIHTGEKPFTCETCGKSFASSSYFNMHKRIHTGYKTTKCKFCNVSFINSDQLKIHVRQKHTGERPYLCEMCSHTFTNPSSLFRHKRDVHREKVQCPICSKFYSPRLLKEHMRRHKDREDGIKRFICDLCGRRFTCAGSRKRHMVIHSGEKAYKCEVCEKSFNQSSTLQTHMRIHSQIKPFQCEFCSSTFRYKHHLKSHCEKQHKSEENCEIKS